MVSSGAMGTSGQVSRSVEVVNRPCDEKVRISAVPTYPPTSPIGTLDICWIPADGYVHKYLGT